MCSQKMLGLDLEADEGFGHWLAGFTDGEGAFMIHAYTRTSSRLRKDGTRGESRRCEVTFQIKLRLDDISILVDIQQRLNCGAVFARYNESTKSNTKPVVIYVIRASGSLRHVIVPLFRRFHLRAKKRLEFEIWSEAVEIAYNAKKSRGYVGWGHNKLPSCLWVRFVELEQMIKKVRAYDWEDTQAYLNSIPRKRWGTLLRRLYDT